MRVCFLVPDLSPSGGVHVIQGHAQRLADEHGADVSVVPIARRHDLDAARAISWDVVLATWWTTIPYLHELSAVRRAIFAQGYDPLHYRPSEFVDRLAATAAMAAPVDVIAVSDWVSEMVRAGRPSARCRVVRPGIDKSVFGGGVRQPGEGPLRILIEGQPSVWFKGVADALLATGAMRRSPHVTLVATELQGTLDVQADRVVGGLDAAGMAQLYREVDVVVKLSRFEGLGLAPLEAFHAGVPSVVTPYGGHAEYLSHGENGLVVSFDDLEGTTRVLDRLDEDRELLARLSEGALRTAAEWPDPVASTAEFHDAIADLGAGEGDPAMLETIVRETGPNRMSLAELYAKIDAQDRAIAHEQGRVAELDRSRIELSAVLQEHSVLLAERATQLEECQARNHELGTRLEEVMRSRAYRAAIALRSLIPGRR